MAQKALDFDKIDDIVTVPAHASLNNIFDGGGSLESWIKPDSSGEVGSGRVGEKADNGWSLAISEESGGMVRIYFGRQFTTTNGVWYSTVREITIGSWNYLVVTYDSSGTGNDPIFYVNGSSVGVTESTTPDGTRKDDSADDTLIGNRLDQNRTFEGIIDEVRLSTKIRTSTEISNTWNSGLGKRFEVDGDTEALWHMDEGADSTIYDETANNNDGTIDGASWIDGFPFPIILLIMEYYRRMREA